MAFEAKEDKIYSLLNDSIFDIPRNQRIYVWKSNNMWSCHSDDLSFVLL